MESLRFLFTSSFYPPYHVGGDAVHVRYLAEELANRGHEVHVLHSLDAYRLKRREILQEDQASSAVKLHAVSTPFSLSAYSAFAFGGSHTITRRLRTLIEQIRPDVVHHHNVSLLGYGVLKKRGDYLNLYTAHDYWLICPQSNLLQRGLRVCETGNCIFCGLPNKKPPQLWRYSSGFKRAVDDIDVLIAPSEYLRQRMDHAFRVRTVTIRNFVPAPPDDLVASGHRIIGSDFMIYVGVLEIHKGILWLIEEYQEIEASNLVIVGQGSLLKEVDRLIRARQLSERVHRLGWIDRTLLMALIRDAQALVVPSIWPENAPLNALEALSLGTPVIGSDRGGLSEIVCKLDKDLVFSWETDGDLKRAILHCLENRENLREKARATYQEDFSPDSYLDSYMKIIDGRDRSREQN